MEQFFRVTLLLVFLRDVGDRRASVGQSLSELMSGERERLQGTLHLGASAIENASSTAELLSSSSR